jgi:hypothetical protein
MLDAVAKFAGSKHCHLSAAFRIFAGIFGAGRSSRRNVPKPRGARGLRGNATRSGSVVGASGACSIAAANFEFMRRSSARDHSDPIPAPAAGKVDPGKMRKSFECNFSEHAR